MPKLYTFYERILAVNMEKMRLDKYLSKVLGVSRSQVAQLVDKKMVLVNGVVAEKNGVWVEESDEIKIAESATFCHSERSEESKKNHFVILSEAKYLKKNQNRDSSVATLSQNDNVGRDSSLRLRSARNDKNSVRVAESALDSADSQNLWLKIQRLYEDDDILVLNKPPFLATHGAPSLKEPSLVEWLKAHKIQRSTISGELREGIVHRLDKQTSGALVVAKNNASHQALSAQLADKTMTRLYLAIIDLPLKEDIEIECFLARNPKNRLKISKVDVRKIRRIAESGKKKSANSSIVDEFLRFCEASDADRTDGSSRKRGEQKREKSPQDEFAIDSALPKFARYSKSKFYKLLPSIDGKKELILARLFTGRTHQIRAHLESINRHIIGDELYGYKRGKGENYRVMLHAYLLELRHPKNTRIFDLDSAESQNLGEKSLSLRDSAKQNRGNPQDLQAKRSNHPPIKKMQDLQDRLPREPSSLAMTENKESAESNEKIKSKKPLKSFCYFLLSQKVESPLPLNPNLPNNADSANLRFIAPLFDDMQDYLAKNFDMEKVNEILRTLPARAF